MLKHTSLSVGGAKRNADNISIHEYCILSNSLIFLNEYTKMKNTSYGVK